MKSWWLNKELFPPADPPLSDDMVDRKLDMLKIPMQFIIIRTHVPHDTETTTFIKTTQNHEYVFNKMPPNTFIIFNLQIIFGIFKGLFTKLYIN